MSAMHRDRVNGQPQVADSEEVERYRQAADDALQQLDWCIGYFAGSHKGALARSLSANRSHIRTKYLRRDEQSTPSSKSSSQSS